MTVCFALDDYIHEQDKPHWFADISDGTRIWSDDGRPGLDEPRSWLRMREYLYKNNLYITKIYVRFRSEMQPIGSSDEGYFFRKGMMADIASGANYHRFIFGLIKDGKIETQTWTVPELLKFDSESDTREIEGHEDSIIWNSPTSQVLNAVLHNTLPS